jgi:hypothetical protein
MSNNRSAIKIFDPITGHHLKNKLYYITLKKEKGHFHLILTFCKDFGIYTCIHLYTFFNIV